MVTNKENVDRELDRAADDAQDIYLPGRVDIPEENLLRDISFSEFARLYEEGVGTQQIDVQQLATHLSQDDAQDLLNRDNPALRSALYLSLFRLSMIVGNSINELVESYPQDTLESVLSDLFSVTRVSNNVMQAVRDILGEEDLPDNRNLNAATSVIQRLPFARM